MCLVWKEKTIHAGKVLFLTSQLLDWVHVWRGVKNFRKKMIFQFTVEASGIGKTCPVLDENSYT